MKFQHYDQGQFVEVFLKTSYFSPYLDTYADLDTFLASFLKSVPDLLLDCPG